MDRRTLRRVGRFRRDGEGHIALGAALRPRRGGDSQGGVPKRRARRAAFRRLRVHPTTPLPRWGVRRADRGSDEPTEEGGSGGGRGEGGGGSGRALTLLLG